MSDLRPILSIRYRPMKVKRRFVPPIDIDDNNESEDAKPAFSRMTGA